MKHQLHAEQNHTWRHYLRHRKAETYGRPDTSFDRIWEKEYDRMILFLRFSIFHFKRLNLSTLGVGNNYGEALKKSFDQNILCNIFPII